MDNEIKKRKYYIYENIDKLKDHNQIINLIKLKHCKFTENGNGIFLNISKLEPSIINVIYQILLNTMDYKDGMIEHLIDDFDEENTFSAHTFEDVKKTLQYQSDGMLLKNYSIEEQEIITYSKKYHL